MAPVETEYYDLVRFQRSVQDSLLSYAQLEVSPEANATDLKKAYRKAAMKASSHCTWRVIESPEVHAQLCSVSSGQEPCARRGGEVQGN